MRIDWNKLKAVASRIPGWCLRNHAFLAWIIAVGTTILATYFGVKIPALPNVPPMPPIVERHMTGGQGWVDDPAAVQTALAQIQISQGLPPYFGRIARDAISSDDGKPVFMWEAEAKVLGSVIPSWDQGSVGCCVSFGWGRGVQDLMLTQIAAGGDAWPGHQVATEPIYGGSRVEIGNNRIRGDGSVGAWAAQWVSKYGILFRRQYPNVDLSAYSQSLTRQWGRQGIPGALENVAKQHPVKTVALVQTSDELWAALGSGYPVPVCSNVGYEGTPPADGVMSPSGTWGHCMVFRARYTSPTRGKCFVIQNSWGNYLKTPLVVTDATRGQVTLPEGCFAVTAASAQTMLAQGDSFAISSFQGFPAQKPADWFTRKPQRRQIDPPPLFTLVP
jgi:hypothetical protein